MPVEFISSTNFGPSEGLGYSGLEPGNGRVMIHIVSGGSDQDQRREGDYATREHRYRRSEEFIEIIRRIWYEDGPISHEGEFRPRIWNPFRRGWDIYEDARAYGAHVLPLVRQELAHPPAAPRPQPRFRTAARARAVPRLT